MHARATADKLRRRTLADDAASRRCKPNEAIERRRDGEARPVADQGTK